MSSRKDTDFLNDIQEAIQRIQYYLDDTSYEIFVADIKTQDAVIRNIEIIGEAYLLKNLGKLPKSESRFTPLRRWSEDFGSLTTKY